MGFGMDEDCFDLRDEDIAAEWELLSKGIWETEHEGLIKIMDMKDSHLNNTIRMIERHLHDGTYDEEGEDKVNLREAQLAALRREKNDRLGQIKKENKQLDMREGKQIVIDMIKRNENICQK